MKTAAVEINGQTFAFRVEETILDEIKIENEAASLMGGVQPLSELKSAIDETLNQYHKSNDDKYGKVEYAEMRAKFDALRKTKDGELPEGEREVVNEAYTKLWEQINDNRHFVAYLRLQTQLDNIYGFARIIVLCQEKPQGFNFRDQKSDFMKEVLAALDAQKFFFRGAN